MCSVTAAARRGFHQLLIFILFPFLPVHIELYTHISPSPQQATAARRGCTYRIDRSASFGKRKRCGAAAREGPKRRRKKKRDRQQKSEKKII